MDVYQMTTNLVFVMAIWYLYSGKKFKYYGRDVTVMHISAFT